MTPSASVAARSPGRARQVLAATAGGTTRPVPGRPARVPFRPGTGARPPYLAGRGEEQELLREFLVDLDAGLAPGTLVILYGPRGNGKTALLGWLEREAGRSFGGATRNVLPTEIPDPTRLVARLRQTRWYERLTSGTVAGVGLSWGSGEPAGVATARVLAATARRKPLLLLLDEAHRLRPEAGEALLTAAQRVASELPFLLVLAGTPDLRPTWEPSERRSGIGRRRSDWGG